MKVLITGGTGFLGRQIVKRLRSESGFVVKLLGKRAECDYKLDLRYDNVEFHEKFDVLVHAAGKAHVIPRTDVEKQDFQDTNVTGTIRLLQMLEANPPKYIIFISTVSVYGCSTGTDLSEETLLNANDVYGKSKLIAENILQVWCSERNVNCVIFRLPLVIGKEAPGNLKSMIEAIRKGYYFNIEGGNARKSMVMADDVANAVIAGIGKRGTFHLTDGYHPSFFEISNLIAKQLGKKNTLNMPFWLAKMIAFLGNFAGNKAPLNSVKLLKITSDLTFNDNKARIQLNWNPSHVLDVFKVS